MNLYTIDAAYCRYLRQYDDLVPYNEGVKQRPFVGIVLMIHAITYFAPLTSPKKKHQTMKSQMDFVKIDHGILGAINLNNMIPVQKGLYQEMKLDNDLGDDHKEYAYKQLLIKQLAWCEMHQKEIQKSAYALYTSVNQGKAPVTIQKRCCRFYQDMFLLQEYCRIHHIDDHKLIKDIEIEVNWLKQTTYRADHLMIQVML